MHGEDTVRGWAFDELHRTVKMVGYILNKTPDADLKTYRDGGDGWTVLQVVCHLRDWETMFLDRAKLIMREDMPALVNWDPDQEAAARKYMEQNVQTAFDAWAKNRADHIILPGEARAR